MRPAQRLLLAAGVCFSGYSALALDSQAQGVSTDDIARCAKIVANEARLACYDLLAGIRPSQIVPPATATPEPRDQAFGRPKINTAKPLEPVSMKAKILEVATSANGAVTVRLDNDQLWQLDDGLASLRVDDSVLVKRAALGSFLMTTPTGRVYRVHRLR